MNQRREYPMKKHIILTAAVLALAGSQTAFAAAETSVSLSDDTQ